VEGDFVWSLSPQPASDILRISGMDATTHEVFVHDLSGRLLLRSVPPNGTAILDIAALAPGHYVVSDGRRGRLFAKQ
jgi:hypothetical protein